MSSQIAAKLATEALTTEGIETETMESGEPARTNKRTNELEMEIMPVQMGLGLEIKASRKKPLADILTGLNDLAETAMTEEDVKGMIERYLANRLPAKIRIETADWQSGVIDGPLPVNFFRVRRRVQCREEVMLVGPAGCGKTTVARVVAESLGLRFGHITLTAGMSEGALLGRNIPTGEGGRFEYNPSQFVDFYENGGVFLLDEMDAADENTLLAINTALANGSMALPNRTSQPEAKRHPDFVCIAAANTFGGGADRMYVGRNQLDGATLDRFQASMIKCGYDSRVEEALVNRDLLLWGRRMRQRIAESGLRRFVSTRFLVKGTGLLARGTTWDDLMDSYFAPWSEDEKKRVGSLAPETMYDPEAEYLEILASGGGK